MKLNLGCGQQVVDGWVNVDYALGARFAKLPLFSLLNRRLGLFNLDWDERVVIHDLTRPFPWDDGAADVVYSSHTLEHFSREQGCTFLAECHRVLRRGGVIRIVVPDLAHIVNDYREGRLAADRFVEALGVLCGNTGNRFKDWLAPLVQYPHRCMYDAQTLIGVLQRIGFSASCQPAFESEHFPGLRHIELPSRTEHAVIVEGIKR